MVMVCTQGIISETMVAIIAIEMNLKIKRDFFLNNNLYDVELYPTLTNK